MLLGTRIGWYSVPGRPRVRDQEQQVARTTRNTGHASGKDTGERTPSSLPVADPATGDDELTGRIWERHVFVCTSGKHCPAVDGDGLGVHARLKALVKEAGLGARVRVNHSGCLDQCGHGPM